MKIGKLTKRFRQLNNAQARIHTEILLVMPLIYTTRMADRIALKKNCYEIVLSDLSECVRQSYLDSKKETK